MKRSSPALSANAGAATVATTPTAKPRARPAPAAAAPQQAAAQPQQQPQQQPQEQPQALPPQAMAPADTAAAPAADGDALSREERIRQAAYERYQQRNGGPGDEHTDWLEAEAHLNRTDPDPAVWAP